jgi:hypothetical protein
MSPNIIYHKLDMELEVVAFKLNNMDGFFLSCSDEDGSPKKDEFPRPSQVHTQGKTAAGKGNKKEATRKRGKRKIPDEVAANEVEEEEKHGCGKRAGMCVLNMDH